MNRIILVGNGFDLAHGMKTRYEDFINWYFEQLKKKLAYYDYSYYEDGFCTLQVNFEMCGASSWRNFIHPNKHKIFKMGVNAFLEFLDYHKKRQDINATYQSLFKLICMSISSKGWVDIEADYYELLKDCPDLNENVVADLQQSLKYLQGKLAEYLLCVQDSATDNINVAINEIINEPILGRDISQYALKHIINSEEDRIYPLEESLILDFNYTHTTDLYHNNVIHIHGKLDSPKSIIFGYGDDLDEYYKKLSNLNDNRYLTNIKSIRYLESGNYRDMLRFINAAPYQLYIMGHSCGNSDRTLLNTLFEHENCVSIKPFYYQKDEENDNYSEITQNISRNFTDMQSFRDKVVDKTRCEPMPQI